MGGAGSASETAATMFIRGGNSEKRGVGSVALHFASYLRLFLSFIGSLYCVLHCVTTVVQILQRVQKRHITPYHRCSVAAAVTMAEGATSAGAAAAAAAAQDEDPTTRVLRRGDLVKVLER